MKVFSIWRCAGSAGVYLSVESGKDTNERHRRYHLQWGANVKKTNGKVSLVQKLRELEDDPWQD